MARLSGNDPCLSYSIASFQFSVFVFVVVRTYPSSICLCAGGVVRWSECLDFQLPPNSIRVESFCCSNCASLGFPTCRVCLAFVGLTPLSVVGSLVVKLSGSFKR